ncbi:hypothetical protein [Haloferula sargassicola]|uniref:Uncharacterized protein n=1 Tax=Haloferula sargassicola TaxID=490096 RepID=A0ABP9UT29_9BACT
MNVKTFVTGSAALLAAWLGATFVRQVPGESYPQLGRGSKPLSAQISKPGNAAKADTLPQLAGVVVDAD